MLKIARIWQHPKNNAVFPIFRSFLKIVLLKKIFSFFVIFEKYIDSFENKRDEYFVNCSGF
jgi:hypothetical protein